MDDGIQPPWMEVSEIRRSLCHVRKLWKANSPDSPFNMSSSINKEGMDISTFCFRFMSQHHLRKKR